MKAAPVIDFTADSHSYLLNGKPVPSVTQVLDWALAKFDMVPPEILEAARVFGNHVHQMVDLFNCGDLDEESLDPRLAAYLVGYKKFLHDTRFLVIHGEKRVASVKYGYCGTLDLFGDLHNRNATIDIKSAATLPRTVGLQCAAYEQALQETTGEKSQRRYCLQLKEGDYRLVELKGLQDFTWFQSTLNVWRFWHSPALA